MLDLVELKKLCDEYDAEHGTYPESPCEGEAIYEFAVERAAKAVEGKFTSTREENPCAKPGSNG